jgi:3-methyladenine DNA glycosylase/8-oxoguanine DNA glycosylase
MAKASPASSLTLSYQGPYQWDTLLNFYRQRCINGVEVVGADSYSRSFRIDGQSGYFTVAHTAATSSLTVLVTGAGPGSLPLVQQRIARQFDVASNPAAIAKSLGKHPALQHIVRQLPGMRLPGIATEFEAVIRAIAGQQISVKAARTLLQRLCERCGARLPSGDGCMPMLLFPEPQDLLAHSLDGLGFTGKRVAWMQHIAERYANGFSGATGDLAASVKLLASLPGIGEWSAHYIAMRALGEADAFPTADLGLLNALRNPERPSARQLQALAEEWRPWRAYATLYLWHTL